MVATLHQGLRLALGTITFCIDGSNRHIINSSSMGTIGTTGTGSYALNVKGHVI